MLPDLGTRLSTDEDHDLPFQNTKPKAYDSRGTDACGPNHGDQVIIRGVYKNGLMHVIAALTQFANLANDDWNSEQQETTQMR